ncbi:MAG: ribosome-associated translation inhibitor RaiA [Pseudomonadota bacterium]
MNTKMHMSIRGKGVDIGIALRDHIERSLLEQITKYVDRPGNASVTLSIEAHQFRADIQVHFNRRIIVQGHAAHQDAYASFDAALVHVAKRLRRNKRRLRDDHHRNLPVAVESAHHYILPPLYDEHGENASSQMQESSEQTDSQPPDGDDNQPPVIVAEMEYAIETLSVSEAVMRMDLACEGALMFRNAGNGQLNMVYQRGDGHIGWINPQPDPISPDIKQ